MKKIWEVQYQTLPPVLKHCKKCGRKMEFISSGQFRVNAQRKYLDIWLIYKCSKCNATWNAAIYSRISPQSLNPELLDRFYKNDGTLAEQYAMDSGFLQENGVEVKMPAYSVVGDVFPPDETMEIEIKSNYYFPIKISSLVRTKLHLSQKEYTQLITDGKIESVPEQDLKKCKWQEGMVLVFNRKSFE